MVTSVHGPCVQCVALLVLVFVFSHAQLHFSPQAPFVQMVARGRILGMVTSVHGPCVQCVALLVLVFVFSHAQFHFSPKAPFVQMVARGSVLGMVTRVNQVMASGDRGSWGGQHHH